MNEPLNATSLLNASFGKPFGSKRPGEAHGQRLAGRERLGESVEAHAVRRIVEDQRRVAIERERVDARRPCSTWPRTGPTASARWRGSETNSVSTGARLAIDGAQRSAPRRGAPLREVVVLQRDARRAAAAASACERLVLRLERLHAALGGAHVGVGVERRSRCRRTPRRARRPRRRSCPRRTRRRSATAATRRCFARAPSRHRCRARARGSRSSRARGRQRPSSSSNVKMRGRYGPQRAMSEYVKSADAADLIEPLVEAQVAQHRHDRPSTRSRSGARRTSGSRARARPSPARRAPAPIGSAMNPTTSRVEQRAGGACSPARAASPSPPTRRDDGQHDDREEHRERACRRTSPTTGTGIASCS